MTFIFQRFFFVFFLGGFVCGVTRDKNFRPDTKGEKKTAILFRIFFLSGLISRGFWAKDVNFPTIILEACHVRNISPETDEIVWFHCSNTGKTHWYRMIIL